MPEGTSTRLYQQVEAHDNASQYNGDIYGGVYNNHNGGDVYLNQKSPYGEPIVSGV